MDCVCEALGGFKVLKVQLMSTDKQIHRKLIGNKFFFLPINYIYRGKKHWERITDIIDISLFSHILHQLVEKILFPNN